MNFLLLKNFRTLALTAARSKYSLLWSQSSQFTQGCADFTRFLILQSFKLRKMPEIKWIPCSNGNYPPGAYEGGFDNDSKLFIVRAYHEGSLVPGKLHASYEQAYIPIGGKEYETSNYEVLVAPSGSVGWVASSDGKIHENALLGGKSKEGETLYIGRVHHLGTLTLGKIHPSHGVCYIPYDGIEMGFHNYDILVENKSDSDASDCSSE